MKKIFISVLVCVAALLGGAHATFAETTNPTASPVSISEMMAKIQGLMKLVVDLQAKLAEVQGEVKELTKDLMPGIKDDDVKKVQELLASDPSIFPVEPTGFFGPRTEEAIKKFQERYGLPVTGVVDEGTRQVMKELRKERKNGMVPPGLINSDEVKDRVLARLKMHHHDEDDDHEDDHHADRATPDHATREDAIAIIGEAQSAIVAFRTSINEMDESDEDAIDEAWDVLHKAQKKLAEARRKLARGSFKDALEKAEDALEVMGEDESAVSGGDEDEDEDEDEEDDSEDDDEDD